MKRIAAGLAVGLSLLPGCAQLPSRGADADDVDTARMGAIERVARANAVQVIWLNPLKKRKAAATASAPSES